MSRVLLLGRAGAGKTHTCLVRLVSALEARKRALLLVPTYGQAEHLRYGLVGLRGAWDAVLTFENLAEQVAGQRLSQIATPPVRDRVAEDVLAPIFPKAAAQPGFRSEFLAAVKELKEQGDPIDDVLARARAHFPERSRGRRLFEAYAVYIEALQAPDHEDLLLETRDVLRARPQPCDLLLVDGFHDFTLVQRQIIDELAAHATECVVTLPTDRVSAGTRRHFAEFAREDLTDNRRSRGALAHLERSLFRPPGERVAGDGIELIACASEEDEADRLARLVAASGRRYNDFLIVRRSFAGLHPVYRAAFRRHGVPLRFFGSEPLGRTPVARAVTLWLRHRTASLPLTDLLPLLRSPYLLGRPSTKQVDALARHIRRDGEPLTLDEFDEVRKALERDELLPFGLRDAVIGHADGDEDLARAGAFLKALAAEVEARPDPEHLLRRIPLISGANRDRRHDCVYAVGAREARQWEKPVVCVAGLTADAFPQQVRQDIFLRDDERRELSGKGVHMPLRKRKEDEERFLFYVALTRAKERLVLTYPAFDEQGTPRAPSPYLESVREMFLPRLEPRVVPLSEQFAQPRDAVARYDLLPIVADGLREERAVAVSLYEKGAVPVAELAWPRRLELLRTRPIDGVVLKHLSPTGINAYERCPFLFLATRVLRAYRPRPHGLGPLELGNIAHTALERYVREPRDPGAIFDEVFFDETRTMRLGIENEAARRLMRRAVVEAAGRIDLDAVLEPEKKIEPVIEGVKMRGRIDRIDRCGDDGSLIVDYKTGVSGERRQLDCYLLSQPDAVGAAFDWIKKGKREGYVLEGYAAEGCEELTREAFEARKRETREAIRAVADAAAAGRLAVSPSDPETCTRSKCDGYDLCRVQRARWLAKAARGER